MNLTLIQFAIAQLIFMLVGIFDWCNKDSWVMSGQEFTDMPKIYSATPWGVINYTLCAIFVSILAYYFNNWHIFFLLTGILTEDLFYFSLRAIYYNQPYTDTLWLPFGWGSVPMKPILYLQTTILTITLILIGVL